MTGTMSMALAHLIFSILRSVLLYAALVGPIHDHHTMDYN